MSDSQATVTWGIIGCGDVCERKAGPALAGVTGSQLAAVMRRTTDLAADFARRHNVPRWYDDMHALLSDEQIDAVYVATPDAAHHACTLAAIAAGKDVLVEKAMASNTAECDEMIAAAQAKGVVLAVAYYRRGYPTILRAKQLIEQGAIGPVRQIHINDEFPLSHRLDLMHYFNGEMERVHSVTQDLPPCSHAAQGPMLYCEHRSGAVSVTPAGWDENLVAETLDIRGESGRIIIADLKAGLLITHIAGEKTREEPGPLPATHWGLIDNFVKHRQGIAPLACDGIEGRKSTVILDIIERLVPDGVAEPVRYG